jgi:hypothetical protein
MYVILNNSVTVDGNKHIFWLCSSSEQSLSRIELNIRGYRIGVVYFGSHVGSQLTDSNTFTSLTLTKVFPFYSEHAYVT